MNNAKEIQAIKAVRCDLPVTNIIRLNFSSVETGVDANDFTPSLKLLALCQTLKSTFLT